MTQRQCWSCAATTAEASFPVRGKLCNDCLAWRERGDLMAPAKIQTRASYRAKLRARLRSPQRDWIDEMLPCP